MHCKLVGQRDSAIIEAAYRDPRDCLKGYILRFIAEQEVNSYTCLTKRYTVQVPSL